MMVLVTAALLVTTGMRPATYGDLLADVASGKVDEVQHRRLSRLWAPARRVCP
ncbi:hypothetical protein [Nocardioides astragali]|uniref:Uncharacterized protein n=1 Tax=Nocardioides astragali TaxID=1776736 RepID=A0ABW2N0C6_9ACTN|nr:hypothetical protein [Nocardioides astragali]